MQIAGLKTTRVELHLDCDDPSEAVRQLKKTCGGEAVVTELNGLAVKAVCDQCQAPILITRSVDVSYSAGTGWTCGKCNLKKGV